MLNKFWLHDALFGILLIAIFTTFCLHAQTRQELIQAMQSENPDIQARALIPALQSPDPALHEYALQIWRTLPMNLQKQAIPGMMEFYKTARWEMQCQIWRCLCATGILTPEIQTLVLQVLAQGQIEEQMEALEYLMRLYHQADFATLVLIQQYPSWPTELKELALQVFIRVQPRYEAIESILKSALASSNVQLRWQAAFLAGAIGAQKLDAEMFTLLQARLHDPEVEVISRAAEALGKCTPATNLKILESLWNLRQHPDTIVKIYSMTALLRITKGKQNDAMKILLTELGGPIPFHRLLAAQAILSFDPKSSKAMQTLIQTGRQLPREAIGIMGNLCLPDPLILEFLDRQYQIQENRLVALSALWQLYKTTGQPKLTYFRDLLRSERDPEAREFLQGIK